VADKPEDLSVGNEPPLTPKRSLPSYREPTPETHRKMSREEEAELALKNTEFTSASRALLVGLFLATITAVAAIQLAAEFSVSRSPRRLSLVDIFSALPSPAKLLAVRNLADVWHLFPRAGDLKAAENALENDSVVAQWLLPRVQSVLTNRLLAGNEQVYLGHDGWLFYRADVDYVTGRPFLDPLWAKRRAQALGLQPDAIKAIVDFRNQLARRGIDLIVLPTPVKPTIEGEMLAEVDSQRRALENESFGQFKALVENEGIRLFDPEPLLMQKAAGRSPLYLKADTHWRPETMEFVAEQFAAKLNLTAAAHRMPLQITEKKVAGLGDIARMLRLKPAQTSSRYEEVTIRQINAGNGTWRPSKEADVLLLGDSFSNIFSLEALGWGESAGFAEHLSHALQGRPIDCILRNSDGASATREILSHELARGRDRLAGKILVIWQFATRELAFGNWKLLDMSLRQPSHVHFFTPQAGEEITVTGTVAALAAVPRPGSVPYADHIVAMHLVDVSGAPQTGNESLQCVAYVWSMRDNGWTPAARLRPGDRITVRLRSWADVSEKYEKINRSDIDDPELTVEEPAWAEFVK